MIGPMVLFHTHLGLLFCEGLPSMLFPPQRKKDGFSPPSVCIRSILIPFGLELYVGGNKLRRLKFSDPTVAVAASKVMDSELLTFGAAAGGVNWYVTSVHTSACALTGISVLANVVPGSVVDTRATVKLPW